MHKTFLDGLGGYPDISNLPVNNSLDLLEVRKEAPLGDPGDVGPNTAFFLGLATSPDVASLAGTFAC